MKIGIIGAHIVGMPLADEFAKVGHDVLIANSPGLDSVKAKLEEAGANANVAPASIEEVNACELVVLAAPWVKREAVLDPAYNWNGRTLLDVSNIYLSYPPNYRVDDMKGDSGSEIVARLAPTARVVKAFNTLDFGIMFSPPPTGMKRVLFAAGDDESAVAMVCGLIREVGFHPVSVGSLATGVRLMDLENPLSLLEVFKKADG